MKKLYTVIIISLILITGCSKKELTYVKDNGYMYTLANEKGDSWLLVRLDPTDDMTITSLSIVAYQKEAPGESVSEKLSLENPKGDDFESTFCEYSLSDYGDEYAERILINFFVDGDLTDHQQLVEYLGLKDELEDGILSDDELKNAQDFRYKDLFEGEFTDVISALGDI